MQSFIFLNRQRTFLASKAQVDLSRLKIMGFLPADLGLPPIFLNRIKSGPQRKTRCLPLGATLTIPFYLLLKRFLFYILYIRLAPTPDLPLRQRRERRIHDLFYQMMQFDPTDQMHMLKGNFLGLIRFFQWKGIFRAVG